MRIRRSRRINGGAGNGNKGRKPSVDAVEVKRLHDKERLGPAAIARKLGIGRASVYRAFDKDGRAEQVAMAPSPRSPAS